MKKTVVFIVMLLFAARLFAQDEPPEYKVAAARFEKFYNANMPDSISKNFSPEMKAALPKEKFKETTTLLKSQLGTLQKAGFLKYNCPLGVYKATCQNGV